MKPPVLIVCYRRPRNLELILGVCENKSRDIFIFIDKTNQADELNTEVCRISNAHKSVTKNIHVLISDTNLGVGYAVPKAINWALESCESLIVFEDDCLPNKFALEYFDKRDTEISESIVLVSGSTLPNFPQRLVGYFYESKFPLIWGWALTKASWAKIRPDRKIYLKDVCLGICKNPRNVVPILYFYAAVIRVDRGFLKAWDSPVALRMLIQNYKSIIPDCSVISNVGQDRVASHFKLKQTTAETLVTKSGTQVPSTTKNSNDQLTRELNRQIRREVYNMKFWHMLSPLKSLLIRSPEG